MNKRIFLVLCIVGATSDIVCSLGMRSISLRGEKKKPLRRSIRFHTINKSISSKRHRLTICDKNGENDITISFLSNYVPLSILLKELSLQLGHDPKHIRLQINKHLYGNEKKEIDYSKDWFQHFETGYFLNISKLKQNTALFYICKLKKYFMEYEGNTISYTRRNNDKKEITTIKFNLKNIHNLIKKSYQDNQNSSVNNILYDIQDLFFSEQRSESDYLEYEFKTKNIVPLIVTDLKSSKKINFTNKKPLNFIFPNAEKGIKYLKKVSVFENNSIGMVEIQDISYTYTFNKVVTKKKINSFFRND